MTEARIPNDYVIGQVGNGWGVALTTLAFERGFGSLKKPRYTEAKSRVIDEAKAESQEHFKVYSWYPQRAGRADLIEEHARKKQREADPVVRQEITKLLSMHRVGEWTAARARATRKLGRTPGAEGSIGKLMSSNVARQKQNPQHDRRRIRITYRTELQLRWSHCRNIGINPSKINCRRN